MLDGLLMLLSLSALMAIASFLAGSLPLSFSLSQSQLRLVSTIGMGVLVGTSLIVIIPEGIETLYSSNDVGQAHVHSQRRFSELYLDTRWDETAFDTPVTRLKSTRRAIDEVDAINALPGPVIPEGLESTTNPSLSHPPKTPSAPGQVHALGASEPPQPAVPSSEQDGILEHGSQTPHAWVGVSLIMGFILMYLIDKLPSLKPPAPPQRSNIYSLSDLSSTSPSPQLPHTLPKGSFSTTLGLVIHAAADGIALGASSTQPSLSFIIFFAIMVHKAPAAFGLTSVLLKQGLGKRQTRTHLVAFSLAAPAGALFTWMMVHILGGGGEGVSGAQTMKWWTGIILLFSAGTFLYVAMHAMQDDEGSSSGSHEGNHGNGYLDPPQGRDTVRQKPQRSLRLIMAAVFGMLLPLVTQIGHAH